MHIYITVEKLIYITTDTIKILINDVKGWKKMSKVFKVLTINPGSTSTKIAIFKNDDLILEKTLRHSVEEINKYKRISDQLEFRSNLIKKCLMENNIPMTELDAVVGRGGLLMPIEGGTYHVNSKMLSDLREGVFRAWNMLFLLISGMPDILATSSISYTTTGSTI